MSAPLRLVAVEEIDGVRASLTVEISAEALSRALEGFRGLSRTEDLASELRLAVTRQLQAGTLPLLPSVRRTAQENLWSAASATLLAEMGRGPQFNPARPA